MMTNLFSMFDPSSSILCLNWFSMFMYMIFIPMFGLFSSKYLLMIKFLLNFIVTELTQLLSNYNKKGVIIFFISIFLFILVMNVFALLPYAFTSSAHLVICLPLAVFLWISINFMGWLNNFYHMMVHLVPMGTPTFLCPLMVFIEIVSQIIRPITLSVRLSANMIAGHLLLSILGSFSMSNYILFTFPILMCLSFLEICVSLIQSYVFMVLVLLYSTEI